MRATTTTITTTERRGHVRPPTYRSMQVDEPRAALHPVEREIPAPGAGHVRVTVEAVGVCHSDALFISRRSPTSAP